VAIERSRDFRESTIRKAPFRKYFGTTQQSIRYFSGVKRFAVYAAELLGIRVLNEVGEKKGAGTTITVRFSSIASISF
jgi:hypothetical protein